MGGGKGKDREDVLPADVGVESIEGRFRRIADRAALLTSGAADEKADEMNWRDKVLVWVEKIGNAVGVAQPPKPVGAPGQVRG